MKSKEELTALKEEVEALNKKLAELSEDELQQVSGGFIPIILFGAAPTGADGTNLLGRGGINYAKDILD